MIPADGVIHHIAEVIEHHLDDAAGVVVMGLEKITFGWYMKKMTWIVLVGYLAGILTYWLEKAFLF
jgi:hypothetical protein